jgi:putative DNA primase/helicase
MNKPTALPVQFESIPIGLKKIPRWVLWRLVEVGEGSNRRWSKLPLQSNGSAASSTNPETWCDFLHAQEAYQAGRYDGIGFVFDGSDGIVGVDLDDCIDPSVGIDSLTPEARAILEGIEGYAEISPSGTGLKIFTRADLHAAHVDHDIGLEVYPRGRYFTVTGHVIGGAIPDDTQNLTDIVPERQSYRSGDDFADYSPPLEGWDLARVETDLLAHLDPDCGYADWLQVGMALQHQFAGDYEGQELWDRWSYQDGKCAAYVEGECARKWNSFSGTSGTTLRTLVFKVNRMKEAEVVANGEKVLTGGPLNHAREFLSSTFACEEGTTLATYGGDMFSFKGTHYEDIEEATVRSMLYTFLDKCKKYDKKMNLIPFNPGPSVVSGVLDAVQALTHLPNKANTRPPVWLEGHGQDRPDPSKLVSLQNGIFHTEQNILLPHSLGFFTLNSLPFQYDPSATCPTWEAFLADLWSDDPESIECLQEMFGYILSGDSSQQKFFNIIGPRRSGKGTINKVLVSLLGQHNTVAPQLEELCDTFGLQPWLGKLLASFTDARAPERNRGAVVSQLLRIVGGDTVTVNRKNKEAWSGYLPTRIVIYSNEALQLTENSNALTGRMIVLKMSNSFYGREDVTLSDKLAKELPGIFNWSIAGQQRRMAREGQRFQQPKTGRELLELMEELSNPIGSFVQDALVYDPIGHVNKDDVFTCWKKWALAKNIPPGTDLAFKRRFLAATQDHRVVADRVRENGEQLNVYRGVVLNVKARKYVDSISNFEREEIFA